MRSLLSVSLGISLWFTATSQSALAQDRACCLGDGNCVDTNQAGCDASSGEFLEEGSTCATTECLGACCWGNEYCRDASWELGAVTRNWCESRSFDFQGAGTTCVEHCATRLQSFFTYQGQIKQHGGPLSGPVDLTFSVWTTARGGDQIGNVLLKENVPVAGGLFSVLLDFDVEVFSGYTRWLEIAVRSPHDDTDSQPFTTLSSRQLISATPYSLQTRGLFVGEFGNIHVIDTGAEPFEYTRLAVQTPNYGVLGPTEAIRGENSHGGMGVVGVVDNTGFAIFGDDQTEGDRTGVGVLGRSSAEKGTGVKGIAASGTGINYGGTFGSGSDEGTAVFGQAYSNTGTNFGVKGQTDSPDGYAGYFVGGRNYFEGNVGIATESPLAKLEIRAPADEDALRVRTNTNSTKFLVNKNGTVVVGGFDENPAAQLLVTSTVDLDALKIRVGGSTRFAVKRNGYTAVGSNNLPSYQLQIYGDGTAGKPGGGSWASSSDRRLKKNIKDLSGSLARLMKLRSVTFEYKNPEAINEPSGERIGMIAQEVEKVFPDWVSEGGHGYKTLGFSGFEALTVGALRELRLEKDGEIASLRAETETMAERNADLESRVAQLEALVAKLAEGKIGAH